jgi:nicotinate-nucleotide adenylyltransferase
MKLGLFGGSFNPVTTGHVLVALAAREELGLDRVRFIPAAQSPFKSGVEIATATARSRLLRLALAGLPWAEVDLQEVARGGVSFTIETVRDHRARFPGATLFWLIGADHVPTLPKWRDAAELAATVEFVVVPRPGEGHACFPAPFRGRELRGWPLGVSASVVRDRARAGLPLTGLVPATVEEVIVKEKLFGNGPT